MTNPKKSVLVIGGGAAGHQIAYQLRDIANVTLVDPKTYWEVPMAVPRLLVEPDALPARLRYSEFLGNASHIQGKVVQIFDNSAKVLMEDDSEQTVKFAYAVIATGSRYIDPLLKAQAKTEEQRSNEIAAMHARLILSQSVVVAGGGPVGVEMAGELVETFPNLKVTLVHGGTSLLEGSPSKFPDWAETSLRKKGVQTILNDRVANPPLGNQPIGRKVHTTGGLVLDADTVIWAAGTKPVSDFVADTWPYSIEKNGLLKVDEFLRLQGHPTIFVAGDVASLPEGRLAIIAGLHVKSVVGNLKRALIAHSGTSIPALKPYEPSPPGKGMGKLMIVTLGRKDGLTSLPVGQFRASFLARKIKAKDMLVGMFRKAVGKSI